MRHLVGLLLVTGLLAGCGASVQEDSHGYIPPDIDVDAVTVGLDTKETVGVLLGSPGAEGVLTETNWFYVQSQYERFLWRAPVEVDRDVLSITFDDRDVVQNIERFGLEDGQVVVLSRRVTDSGIEGISFLRQLFSNFGRLTADQLVSQ